MSRRMIRRLERWRSSRWLYTAFLLGIFVAMHQPVERFGRVMSYMPGPLFMVIPFEPMWNIARAGTLAVGDPAPDFVLHTVDKTGHPAVRHGGAALLVSRKAAGRARLRSYT